MQDHPSATELLKAVRSFLEDDVVPRFEGRRRFHALVAANVLGILEREWAVEGEQLAVEWTRLGALLGDDAPLPTGADDQRSGVRDRTTRLVERIRLGDADDGAFRDDVRAHLRATVTEKLTVANPRHLGGS